MPVPMAVATVTSGKCLILQQIPTRARVYGVKRWDIPPAAPKGPTSAAFPLQSVPACLTPTYHLARRRRQWINVPPELSTLVLAQPTTPSVILNQLIRTERPVSHATWPCTNVAK